MRPGTTADTPAQLEPTPKKNSANHLTTNSKEDSYERPMTGG
jgi:hypothetical protein